MRIGRTAPKRTAGALPGWPVAGDRLPRTWRGSRGKRVRQYGLLGEPGPSLPLARDAIPMA